MPHHGPWIAALSTGRDDIELGFAGFAAASTTATHEVRLSAPYDVR